MAFDEFDETDGFDVPPLPSHELGDFVLPVLPQLEWDEDPEMLQAVLAELLEAQSEQVDPASLEALTIRSQVLLWFVLADAELLSRLRAMSDLEGPILEETGAQLSALIDAVASVPAFCAQDDGQQLVHVDMQALARNATTGTPSSGGALKVPGPAAREVLMDPVLAQAFGRFAEGDTPPGETLGQRVARMAPKVAFHAPLDEYPHYRDLMGRRAESLAGLTPAEAAVYEAPPFAEGSEGLVFASFMLSRLPTKVCVATGLGAWSQYPALYEMPDWDFAKYREVVLRSPVHAAIPCRAGLLPIHYIVREGSYSDFKRIVELAPETLNQLDGQSRPILHDIAQRRRDEQFAYAVKMGADIYQMLPAGQTSMYTALMCGNHNAVEVLLDAGFDLAKDAFLDRTLVDRFLIEPSCPPELRNRLSAAARPLARSSEMRELFDQLFYV
ncbi:hypothetical protein E4T66_17315 [Sinimarinibacterium sp. CAU 1509]|uniref:hypothetical protein n=1 Tax=Sinimarinibacterium sp. CAU 1509 TaxID=2562283 RepID=UPI0010ABD65C|nr:hypothetical protein [Sinimarinibacterium sp. CAU 1509]TJY57170.1 hypothetical protein E4T66_17315 [Sinimarinibacterium sp. CAU 1509]